MCVVRRGRDSGGCVLLGETESVAMYVVRRGRVSGGCALLGEAESVLVVRI
jgi:hypothetical protein